MRLAQRSETFTPPEDQSWLGSSHGTSNADPITLLDDAFLTDWDDGIVPSGVILGKVTATGLYVPYDEDGVDDGREVAAGILATTKVLNGVGGKTPAALQWHGEVIEAKLPTGHGLDAAAKTDLKHIRFV
jgi:hypothetical protein